MTDSLEGPEAGRHAGPHPGEEFLNLVYQELRRLAAAKMGRESTDHTLQPTALVHEAWLRLMQSENPTFSHQSEFFAAAGEVMRRILIDSARRRKAQKRGGGMSAEPFDALEIPAETPTEDLLALHAALDDLAREDPLSADLVKLRYFVGMTMDEAARALELPVRSAERLWAYARAWLRRRLQSS